MVEADPIHRSTARVLPVSPDGEVLLLQDQDPAHPGELRWGSIGGAVDPGESPPVAAVRELWEETGIAVLVERLAGPVHRREHAYSYDAVAYVGDSTYFAVPVARDVVVSFDNLVPDEVGNVFAAEWWTPADLAAHGSFADPDLPGIMRAAIAAVGGDA